jgi:hypothetical protein
MQKSAYDAAGEQSSMMSEQIPSFGGDNGLIYPAVARVLRLLCKVMPSSLLNLPASGVDALILVQVCVEIVIVLFLHSNGINVAEKNIALVVAVDVLALGILMVIFVVNISEFFLGYSRSPQPWVYKRGIVLKTINLGEIILLYGILFFTLGRLFPGPGKMNESLVGIFDSIYFSTVTATTLGYGDYSPVGWLVKALAMSEVLFVIIIGLGIISFLKSRTWAPEDVSQIKKDSSR